MWVLGSDQVDSLGQVHVTLSRSSAVASLAADVMRCGPLKHLGIAWFFWLPLGQVHVTLSRIAAVASLAADELNTASSLLEITLAYSLPLRFAKLSKIASHNSHLDVLLPTWSSDIVLIPIGGV